ncbi:MAG TPA: DNA repair protein RecO [Deltaproteobacteria bacterium]|nr:MAG: hypothetical protein IEMM0003_0547 [bacterium]HDH10537.1 DNA repair protein RecO [Deltaproteobacteria bacterium]
MKIHLIHAITLNSIKIGETDRLLDLFSYNHGRLLCTARGASRIKNRFGEAAEPINESKFWVSSKEGRISVVAKEANIVDSFKNIHSDFLKLNLAFFISEIVGYFFKRGDPAPEFWLFLRKFLKNMENSINPMMFAFFFIKILSHNGLLADKICSICGSPLNDVSICGKNGFMHKECSDKTDFDIAPSISNPIFYFKSIKLEKVQSVHLSPDVEKMIVATMYKILLMHISKPLKTAKFWEGYINNYWKSA